MRIIVLVHAPRRAPSRPETLSELAPCESAALRAALALGAAAGNVVAMTAGLPREDEVLRAAVELGADRAIRVWDPAVDLDNPRSVGALLATAIREVGFDLVLAGDRSAGFGSGTVGPAVAHYLDLPHLTGAVGLSGDAEALLVQQKRSTELLAVRARPPLVVTVLEGPGLERQPPELRAAIEVCRPGDGSHRDATPALLRGTMLAGPRDRLELVRDAASLLEAVRGLTDG